MRAAAEDQYKRLFSQAPFSSEAYVSTFLQLDNYGRSPKRPVFEQLVAHFDLRTISADELLADRDAAAVRCVQLCPGARECLTDLQADGFTLGLVTNGRFPLQRDKAVAAGLAPFFATIVVSEQEGVEKPDAAIFRTALARLGAAPELAVFVGDDPMNDISGAQSVGMKAVFVASFHHKSCAFADASVGTLAAVREVVRNLLPAVRVKDPLEGKTLEKLLTELVDRHGWDFLANAVKINCFSNDPSVSSSLKFLRRTPWARAKVEALYLRTIVER